MTAAAAGPRPRLSLIIVNYNTRDLLCQCLASIAQHEPGAEVIVIDNASRDGSAAAVREGFPTVTCLDMGWNAGFAAANNAGLARARGDYLVLLNSDTVLEDDSLSRCVAWMDAHPDVGATSPKLMGTDDRPQLCLYPMPSVGVLVRQALRRPVLEGPVTEGWLAGTALMLRREALAAIGGGLDDGFWMYWEDADLSARLRKAGWRLEPFPGGQIRHHGGASGGGDDAARRADLHAWYLFGKYRWFAKHGGFGARAAVLMLDTLDVARKAVRGTIYPKRRAERTHAGVMLRAIGNHLRGVAPPIPGGGRRPDPSATPGAAPASPSPR